MHYIVSRHQAVDDDMQLIAVFERSAGNYCRGGRSGRTTPETVRAAVGLRNP